MKGCGRIICLLVTMGILAFAGTVRAADPASNGTDPEYRKGVELLQNGLHAESLAHFSRLLQSQSGNGKYQLGRLAALIEVAKEEKELKNSTWKFRGKEAAVAVKQLYRSHIADPDYYLISSRYYALVEREREVDGVLKKALHYRADFAEVSIARGDNYFWLARMTNPSAIRDGATVMTTLQNPYLRHFKAETARDGYEAALKGSGLAPARAAYVCFMLAEVERTIFSNAGNASKWRKRAVELAPDSHWGKKAAEALRAQRD